MLSNLRARLDHLLEELNANATPRPQQGREGRTHPPARHRPHRRSHHHSRLNTSGREQGRRNRPLTSQPTSSHEAKDYDLDLKSLWFAKSPPSFPPPTMNRDGKITYSIDSGWSRSGVRETHTFTAHVRNTVTLASSKIHLTWDASNPGITVKAQQRHDPPPRKLSQSELESCRKR
jgi:hypothetical protein